ncbi:MAG: GNAT family N-acetyltransferase [Holophagaceae bacterium]|nr:GNAT family N-acetyltransferase [Holophagaceae bacterium]
MPSPPIDVLSASGFSLDALTALFNRGFEDYLFPVNLTQESLSHRIWTEDVDLHSCKVALVDGEPSGFAFIARRGCRSRLAAMGVIKESRQQGVGRMLARAILADARVRHGGGDREMRLEVFEDNNAARKLYEGEGFRILRRLSGRTLSSPRAASAPLELHDTPVWNHVVSAEAMDLPWQLEPETLAVLGAPARVASLDGKAWALIYGSSAAMLVLRGLYVRPGHRRQGYATKLIGALAAMHPGRTIHFPPLIPEPMGTGFFERLGFQADAMNQVEMAISFL